MADAQPELYQNESRFGPISGIPVGKTWNNRQASLDGLSRNSLTHSQEGLLNGWNAHPYQGRNFWWKVWRSFHCDVWGIFR